VSFYCIQEKNKEKRKNIQKRRKNSGKNRERVEQALSWQYL
jgi:hypothetical protein